MDALNEINAEFPGVVATFVFIFGAIVGSFLNVCIYRIPAGRSIVSPGSTCACGRPISWYNNIPILSWLVLRGRARCCGEKFSVRYPAIELLTGALFLGCWLRHPPAVAAAGMLLSAMLICATFIDLDHMIIPDRFSIGAAVIGVVISALVPALHGETLEDGILGRTRAVVDSVHGILIGAGLVVMIGQTAEAVLRKEAMGLGDVKLVAGIGAFFGWQGAVFCIFGGAVLGTLGLGVMLLVQAMRPKKAVAEVVAEAEADGSAAEESGVAFGRYIPFGPMLAAGSLLYFLWLQPVVDQYFADVGKLLLDAYGPV